MDSKAYQEYLAALNDSNAAWEAYSEKLEACRDVAETIADMYVRHRAGKNISLAALHEYVDDYEQKKVLVTEASEQWLDAAEIAREAWQRHEEEETA